MCSHPACISAWGRLYYTSRGLRPRAWGRHYTIQAVAFDLLNQREGCVVSGGPSDRNQANSDAPGSTMDCIRVMGWAEFADLSLEGVALLIGVAINRSCGKLRARKKINQSLKLCLQKKVISVVFSRIVVVSVVYCIASVQYCAIKYLALPLSLKNPLSYPHQHLIHAPQPPRGGPR